MNDLYVILSENEMKKIYKNESKQSILDIDNRSLEYNHLLNNSLVFWVLWWNT